MLEAIAYCNLYSPTFMSLSTIPDYMAHIREEDIDWEHIELPLPDVNKGDKPQ